MNDADKKSLIDEEPNKNNCQEKKEIEIVTDDGSTLNISNVSDAIIGKSKDDKPKNIVIPQEKK